MNGPTHHAGAILAGVGASVALGLDPAGAIALTAGSAAAAMAPDVDRRSNPGPNHRALPHSLIFAGGGVTVLAVLASLYLSSTAGHELLAPLAQAQTTLLTPGNLSLVPLGVAAGYLSHLLLDSMTPARIFLLHPGGRRIGLGRVKVGGGVEHLMRIGLVLGALALFLGSYGGDLLGSAAAAGGVVALAAPVAAGRQETALSQDQRTRRVVQRYYLGEGGSHSGPVL